MTEFYKIVSPTSYVAPFTPTEVHSSTNTKSSSWLARPAQARPRSELAPLDKYALWSFWTVMSNSFVTDRIPQFVAYSDLPHTKNKIVACTQTRRVATTAVAQRVADEMDGLFVVYS
jgi:hypothetical protein